MYIVSSYNFLRLCHLLYPNNLPTQGMFRVHRVMYSSWHFASVNMCLQVSQCSSEDHCYYTLSWKQALFFYCVMMLLSCKWMANLVPIIAGIFMGYFHEKQFFGQYMDKYYSWYIAVYHNTILILHVVTLSWVNISLFISQSLKPRK